MTEKNISSRIVHKHDIEANWLKAINFIPKQGEIIVYDVDEVYHYERLKVGDGETLVSRLPFVDFQSDWSVNDPVDSAYIKNRTHWEESAEGTFTNEALSFSYHNAAGLYESDGMIVDSNAYEPTVGSAVSFELNGTSYELTVFKDADGYIAYGDTKADLIAGTGEYGFRVINWWVNRYNIQSLTEITTASVVLHYNYGIYHELDREKYLPTVPGYLDGTSIRFGSNTSTGNSSFAEGFGTKATADFSHAAGMYTKASAERAFAIGNQTVAASYDQFVHGRYNIEDSDGVYAHIVGNGDQLDGDSNAHTLDWSGNAWFAGEVKVGGASQDDTVAKTLATTEYVDSKTGSWEILMDVTLEEECVDVIGITLTDEQKEKVANSAEFVCYVQCPPPSECETQGWIQGGLWADNMYYFILSAYGQLSGVVPSATSEYTAKIYSNLKNASGDMRIRDMLYTTGSKFQFYDFADTASLMANYQTQPMTVRFKTNGMFAVGTRLVCKVR